MPHAQFTFHNLPDFLKGSETGVLSGSPTITGTFRFKVSYTNGEDSGEEETVLSISSSPNTPASDKQNKEVVELIVTTALNTWIFRVNSPISVQLSSTGGHAPVSWNFKNLPKGLYGNSLGQISGSVQEAGLYSFSAECGDDKKKKASMF